MPKIIDKLKEPSKTAKASSDLTEASKLMEGFGKILTQIKELKNIAPQQQQQNNLAPAPAPVDKASINMAKEMNPDLKDAVPVIKIREDKFNEILKQLLLSIPESMEEDNLKIIKEKADELIPAIAPNVKKAILQIVKIEYEK